MRHIEKLHRSKTKRSLGWCVSKGLLFLALLFLVCFHVWSFLPSNKPTSLKLWVKKNSHILEREYRVRRETVKNVCLKTSKPNKFGLTVQEIQALRRVNWRFIYYDPIDEFLYCKVLKSGSSTWVFNLLKLASIPSSKELSDVGLHKHLRDYYPRLPEIKMRRVLPDAFKFIVVRNPFERLLSAYRDKLENYTRDLEYRKGYYHKLFGKHIVQSFRKGSSSRIEPTWNEFVRYLIASPISSFDPHWTPTYILCSPCAIKYDVVAKMETFDEDTQYIISTLKLESLLKVEWIHKTSKEKTTSDVTKLYFSNLTRNEIDDLYKKFRLDFLIFGYSYEEFRNFTKY